MFDVALQGTEDAERQRMLNGVSAKSWMLSARSRGVCCVVFGMCCSRLTSIYRFGSHSGLVAYHQLRPNPVKPTFRDSFLWYRPQNLGVIDGLAVRYSGWHVS